MSKIICDICGTSYQETAKQCPICGCVRPGDAQRVTNEIKKDGKVSTGYTHVKGGRFSKNNVKKRTKSVASGVAEGKNASQKHNDDNTEGGNSRGIVITAIVLLLAIIGVVIYIALRFFGPISEPDNGSSSTTDNTLQSSSNLSCTDIILSTDSIEFILEGEGRLLSYTLTPANTSDTVTFRSEDESVAVVTDKGSITAVGEGTTKIVVTCGDVVRECIVTCTFEDQESTGDTSTDSTDNTENTENTESTETTEKAEDTIRLNRSDITFKYKGESWVLYSGDVAKNLITWTSDDESIVTFTEGKAVAVGKGTTKIHAEYEGQKVSCIIRCNFEESAGVGGNGGVSEDGGTSGNGGVSEDGGNSGNTGSNTGTTDNTTYAIYTYLGKAEDITLKVGESITFALKDSDGNVVTATWRTTSNAISLSGSTVKGVSKTGYAKVVATYNGMGYECIVRVSG